MAAETDADTLPPLKMPKATNESKPPRSPNMRRHLSEPGLDIMQTLQHSQQDDSEKEEETEQHDGHTSVSTTTANHNDNARNLDASQLSKDPLKSYEELKKLIESIIEARSKKLPSRSHVLDVLAMCDFWMHEHGVAAIHELKQQVEEYEGKVSCKEKEKEIVSLKMAEYKHEYESSLQRRNSLEHRNKELTQKLQELNQKLQTTLFLEAANSELRDELEMKSMEHAKSLNTAIAQQKQINGLKEELHETSKRIESHAVALSQMANNELELKSKCVELKDSSRRCKEYERKLKRVQMEAEQLVQEKKTILAQIIDYNKLKENAMQFQASEKEYVLQIKHLNAKNMQLYQRISDLSLSSSSCAKQEAEGAVNASVAPVAVAVAVGVEDERDTFADSVDGVQTYNMTPQTRRSGSNDREDTQKAGTSSLAPLFDEREFEKMKQEFERANQSALAMNSPFVTRHRTVSKSSSVTAASNNDEHKKQGQGYGFRLLYRSFVIVGISCLCYLVYSQYYNASTLRQTQQKYEKWHTQLTASMKKKVKNGNKLNQT